MNDVYHPNAGSAGYVALGAAMCSAVASKAREIRDATRIAGMYIGCFNRTAENGGLMYWVNALLSNSRDVVGEGFFNAACPTLSPTDFIIRLYLNLLNVVVTASDPGVQYWLGIYNSQSTDKHGYVMNQLIDAVVNGTDTNSLTYQNCLSCGMAYGYVYKKTPVASVGNLAGVTSDFNTVATFTATL